MGCTDYSMVCCILCRALTLCYAVLCSEQATIKDREWDQFKEDNPKGWGNKNKMG